MIFSMLVLGMLLEVGLIMFIMVNDEVEVVVSFKSIDDWVVFEGDEVGLIQEDSMGVAALYSYGSWLMVVAGWSLFVNIFIVVEITLGG